MKPWQWCKKLRQPAQGQSLVESALVFPILIFFMLGIFEVGWAVRTYMVLSNVNREITRFAVRPGYMDFSTMETIEESYQSVRTWVDTATTGQLELDFDDAHGNATLIVSHLVADTGKPCRDMANCDCSRVNDPLYGNLFTQDDLKIHPGMPGMEYQAWRFGAASGVVSRTTRINYEDRLNELVADNNVFNCEIMKKGGVPSANNIIITELFMDQRQLFGFPIISNPYTDPLPLYVNTTMRMVSAARSTGTTAGNLTSGINSIGPVCLARPFVFKRAVFDTLNPNDTVDILDGNGSPNWGFLAWDQSRDSQSDIKDELLYPAMSVSSYVNPQNGADKNLNLGDYVASYDGAISTGGLDTSVQSLVGVDIIVPVYDGFDSGLNAYRIYKFAVVRIQNGQINLTTGGGGPYVRATYVGPAPAGCN